MSDNDNELEQFMTNRYDFGSKPAEIELNDDQKRLVALAMSVNATVVQLINEGAFAAEHQIHFMGHLQDFMDRIYHGEGVKLDNTDQTLQVNSKAGTLFFQATTNAFSSGSKNFSELKALSQKMVREAEGSEQSPSPKPTLH